MAHRTVFQGAATALITPTTSDGPDLPSLRKLIDWQICQGIDALVICGTTGENATLSDYEHHEVLECAVEAAHGRVPMIAGTGSNDTAHATEMTRFAATLGYDAALCVTPYYNKTTQRGLIAHFETIADCSALPLILYNVPSRTGVNLQSSTCAALAKHPNISGVKEASGNISQILETAALIGEDMDLYSGNDDQIVPVLSCGGKGVISVLSNILPEETSKICKMFFTGDLTGALELQKKYLPLIKALFSEVNPIPVKAALSAMGFCQDYLRLPLISMEEQNRQELYRCMRQADIPLSADNS